jgi:putative endonuclease
MNDTSRANRTGIVRPARDGAQARGEAAEQLAAQYLAARGLQVMARRVRCRGGEIDLICKDREILVFVEVRLRRQGCFGTAADSITARKRARILLAARWWLAGPGSASARRAMRFDAVLLEQLDARSITWIRNAFDAGAS